MSKRLTPAALLFGYSFDLPLADALDDPDLAPVRRALAALAIGTGLSDDHVAAAELAKAAARLAMDRAAGVPDEAGEGAREIHAILRKPGCDFPRALWYAVSRSSPRDATEHLSWLVDLMRARAAMLHVMLDSGALLPLLPRGSADDDGSARLALE